MFQIRSEYEIIIQTNDSESFLTELERFYNERSIIYLFAHGYDRNIIERYLCDSHPYKRIKEILKDSFAKIYSEKYLASFSSDYSFPILCEPPERLILMDRTETDLPPELERELFDLAESLATETAPFSYLYSNECRKNLYSMIKKGEISSVSVLVSNLS